MFAMQDSLRWTYPAADSLASLQVLSRCELSPRNHKIVILAHSSSRLDDLAFIISDDFDSF